MFCPIEFFASGRVFLRATNTSIPDIPGSFTSFVIPEMLRFRSTSTTLKFALFQMDIRWMSLSNVSSQPRLWIMRIVLARGRKT